MTKLQIEHLPLAAIEPNPWNPNKQTDRQFEAEVESILNNGFVAPILARKIDDNKWQIIDGEHRLKALQIIVGEKKQGAGNVNDLVKNAEIPAVVIDVTEAKAKRLTIIMNETRGRADMGSLAQLLSSISDELGEDLITGLPYTPNQLDDMLKLSEFDWDSLAIPEIDDVPEKSQEFAAQVQAFLTAEVDTKWVKFKAENQDKLPKNPKEAAGILIGILLEHYNNNSYIPE